MTQVRVNVSTLVNSSKIRREKRDGRDVIIVPSATMPDDIVMNGSGGAIKYPAEEIAKAYKTLEEAPAPLGHPFVNGKFVSARSPAGLARSYVGAHNENVRRENGRVFLDKVIDVDVANQSEGGRALLSAIDKQEAIHTSTGILANIDPVTNAADHKFVAHDLYFDHDAILLNQTGAATPEQGVGMFVNASGEEMEVINSILSDDIERDEMWALESILRAEERKLRAPLLERIKTAIEAVVRGTPEPETMTNQEASAVDKEQFDALTAKVDALAAAPVLTLEQVTEVVANALKPITDAAIAKADAEKADLIAKVVNAKLLDQETAEATPVATLTALANSIVQTPVAMRVNGAFAPQAGKVDYLALAPKAE